MANGYRNLLVPLDGSSRSEQAVSCAVEIGQAAGLPITLARYLQETGPLTDIAVPGMKRRDASQHVQETEAQAYLERVAAPVRYKGLTVTCLVRAGDSARSILTDAGDGSLVVMSTVGRAGVRRWTLGSVADEVVRRSHNPVLIVHTQHPEVRHVPCTLKHILAPLDGTPSAEDTLPHVASMAIALNLEVVLLGVNPWLPDFTHKHEDTEGQYSGFPRSIDRDAVIYLRQAGAWLEEQGVQQVREEVVHGSPADSIVSTARDLPGVVIAMSTHSRRGLGRWLLGSVADEVVRHFEGPVLLLRTSASRADSPGSPDAPASADKHGT